jgi:branched-chain amino acid transport system substrate-binding protein
MTVRVKAVQLLAVAGIVTLTAAACSSSGSSSGSGGTAASSGSASGTPLTVGLINSYTGSEAVFAKQFAGGFLGGLDYYTKGTMAVDGHPIKILTGDDTGSTSVGTSLAKSDIAAGAKILVGPTDSSVALVVAQTAVENNVLFLSGDSGTDAFAGDNKLVFAMGGYTPAGNQLIKTLLGPNTQGKTIADIEQDYAYGQSVVAGNEALMKPLGLTVKPYLLPLATTDFTAVALQIKNLNPGFITTQWSAGPGQASLYQTLSTQGLFKSATYVGELTTESEWPSVGPAFGSAIPGITFGMNYYAGATTNPEAQAMATYTKAHGLPDDSGDIPGWNDAASVVHALATAGTSSTTAMATAIENYTFTSPAGSTTIRGTDHVALNPAFTIHLVNTNGTWGAKQVKAYTSAELAPPVVKPVPSS